MREQQAFTLEQAVRMLTLVPASQWGFDDRGLGQRARGIAATIVNGEVVLRDGKPTGALPGRLLRGPYARRSAV